MNTFKLYKKNAGFTLLEVLLVIGLIAILAGIVIVAINPGRQIDQANDTQKSSDVNALLNAVYQYAIDNDGTLPDGNSDDIETTAKIIGEETDSCDTSSLCPAVTTDADCIDLADDLVTGSVNYLVSMPLNPDNDTSNTYDADNTGYYVLKDSNDRVTVGSCENDVDDNAITVTR